MWRLVESMLRRLNRYRSSSREKRLSGEVVRLEAALEEARAEGEARVRAAETRARLAVEEAGAVRGERDLLTASNERIRALYEADIAEAAKRIAEGGQ